MTIVQLLKQVENWQSPSRDPWSNCIINSREDDKGQSYNYSGQQKDNSKTICGQAGYVRNYLHKQVTVSRKGAEVIPMFRAHAKWSWLTESWHFSEGGRNVLSNFRYE